MNFSKVLSHVLILIALSFAFSSCKDKTPQELKTENTINAKKELTEQITSFEAKVFANDNVDVKKQKEDAVGLLKAYLNYHNKFNNDSLSADYLFKAGNVALGLGKTNQAIDLFRSAHDGYPGYEKKVEAVYMAAFIYDNELHLTDTAQKFYEFVIANYPEHKLAKDAAARIQTLHMTDEELIKMFEKKNKQS